MSRLSGGDRADSTTVGQLRVTLHLHAELRQHRAINQPRDYQETAVVSSSSARVDLCHAHAWLRPQAWRGALQAAPLLPMSSARAPVREWWDAGWSPAPWCGACAATAGRIIRVDQQRWRASFATWPWLDAALRPDARDGGAQRAWRRGVRHPRRRSQRSEQTTIVHRSTALIDVNASAGPYPSDPSTGVCGRDRLGQSISSGRHLVETLADAWALYSAYIEACLAWLDTRACEQAALTPWSPEGVALRSQIARWISER